ncbi:MAG: hypothetical protein N2376_12550 [Clostridia bacterium]|nr:hypothetical protein [Clostridia bacterium]
MKIKRLLSVIACFFIALTLSVPASLAEGSGPTPPIAKGKMKTVSYVYWGKSEMFPTIGMLGINQEIDIYEYDKEWVLTKYDTFVTQGNMTVSHSFYGYVKRKDVICDPPLEGDASKKADTGPGKRKGKKPKGNRGSATPEPQGTKTATAKPEDQTEEPKTTEISTEDLMEYDWIIRTPGVCQVVVDMGDGYRFVARFGMMATKFGGYTASSLPIYNDGKSNPYVGYVNFSMKMSMQDVLNNNNLGFLQGDGGISIDAFSSNARFNINSETDDATSTIISIMTSMTTVLNPEITDKNQNIHGGGNLFNDQRVAPLDMKLVKNGSGYQLVVLNMRPGGGDLKFPAMLEKFPLDDITKAERERLARERREEQLRKAKELQKKILEDWKKEIEKGMQDELNKDSKKGEDEDIELAPLEPSKSGSSDDDIPLAPLVTPEPSQGSNSDADIPLAPLVTPDASQGSGKDDEIPLAPLVTPDASKGSTGDEDIELAPLVTPDASEGSSGTEDIPLAPLTGGGTSETPDFFPNTSGK